MYLNIGVTYNLYINSLISEVLHDEKAVKILVLLLPVFDSDVTFWLWGVIQFDLNPDSSTLVVSQGVTQIRSQPSLVAAGCSDTSQLQGLCPRHPIAHYQSPTCPMTPHHSPFLFLNDSFPQCLYLCLSVLPSLLRDYSEVCALVKLAVMDSVMHKLFAVAELWHSANRWRTCTSHDV